MVYTIRLVAITFDPKKDAANKRKHRTSLSRAEKFDFETALYAADEREDYGEVRFRAIGFLDGGLYALVFAEDGMISGQSA
jgi:uncharacterized DUF497 family protein